MSFDISIGDQPQPLLEEGDDLVDFESFYEQYAPRLRSASELIALDTHVAGRAFERATSKMAQRWSRLVNHPNRLGWWLSRAIDEISDVLGDELSQLGDQGSGGYARGMALDEAIAALPVRQRGALVAAHFLGWTNEHTALGFDVETRAITTLHTHALSFVTHHLQTDDDVDPLITGHFAEQAAGFTNDVPDGALLHRRGRNRRVLTSVAATCAVCVAIAIAGLAVSVERAPNDPVAEPPTPVGPPGTTAKWFGPVSDGQGGFVALNTEGASEFSTSDDGASWFDETTWNSRRIDLRTEVTSFARTGDRYIATIEAAPSIASSVSPFVASSQDLVSWDVQQVDVGETAEIDGLRTRGNVIATAVSNDRLLVAVRTRVIVDHASLGIRPSDVCTETTSAQSILLFLCNGETLTIDTSGGPDAGGDGAASRLFLREGQEPFVEVRLPPGGDPYSLVSFESGFAMVEEVSGAVFLSDTGRSWRRAYVPGQPNRFVLLGGTATGDAIVVQPDVSGWFTLRLGGNEILSPAILPLSLDPSLVWVKPQLASGPAGWAIFVTTSRPWERSGTTRGWAVEVDGWVISRQPDSRTITASSADGMVTHRYRDEREGEPESDAPPEQGGSVERLGDEGVTLFDPETGELLVEVTQRLIDDSRPADDTPNDSEAQVLFSEDGSSWRSIWQSTAGTWLGSVAVGDDEVLLSGTEFAGVPIVIALE